MINQRVDLIKDRLEKKFFPMRLEVLDDSEKHKGHPGSTDGAGHFTVIIAATSFAGKSRVAIHREIYDVLADLIPGEIHALRIKIEN